MLKKNNPVNTVLRALIVEDDHEFQILLSDSLDMIEGNWRTYSFSLGRDACSFIDMNHGALDLALIDLGLPDMDGHHVISKVKKRFPRTPILIVTVLTSSFKLFQALDAGANGYVLKDDTVLGISSSISEVLKGNVPISPFMAKKIIDRISFIANLPEGFDFHLSEREQELLICLSKGMSYSAAAEAMGLTLATVHSYSKRLFRKLGVNSKSQAISLAQRYYLVV